MKDSLIILNPSVKAMTGSNKKTENSNITKTQILSVMRNSLLSCCGLSNENDDKDESQEIVNSKACIKISNCARHYPKRQSSTRS